MRSSLLILGLLLLPPDARGAVVFFNLDASSGSVATQFEGGATSVEIGGVTLSFEVEPIDASYLALSGANSSGVFSVGEAGNDRARVNASEAVVFTVTSSDNLFLQSLDLTGVGSATGTDSAFIGIDGAPAIELRTGVTNFNGSTDIWSPNLALNSGATIRVTANDAIALQGISFNAVAVPEPSALLFIGVVIPIAWWRREKTKCVKSS